MIILKKKTFLAIVIILIILILIKVFDIPQRLMNSFYKRDYSNYVEKYSNEYGIDQNLVYAVIKAESNFKNDAKSNKEAIGLMQIMTETAKDICKMTNLKVIDDKELNEKLYNPEINIQLGTYYLSYLVKKYNNVELAITAYNAGIGTVDNWIYTGVLKSDGSNIENIPYKETNNYVRKILRDYKIYSKL